MHSVSAWLRTSGPVFFTCTYWMRSRGFVFLQLVVFLRTCLLEKTWPSFFGFYIRLLKAKRANVKWVLSFLQLVLLLRKCLFRRRYASSSFLTCAYLLSAKWALWFSVFMQSGRFAFCSCALPFLLHANRRFASCNCFFCSGNVC